MNNIEMKIEELQKIGYTKDESLKIIKKYDKILLYTEERIVRRINLLMVLGLSKEEVLKMFLHYPLLINYALSSLGKKINLLESLGFERENIIKISKLFPQLLTLNNENIERRFYELISLGYTKDEVINILLGFPALFGFSMNNVRDKLLFYRKIGLANVFLNRPKNLIQSLDLSYARYMFFLNRGYKIDLNNYNFLFLSDNNFKNQFGIHKEEIMQKYSYKESNYLESDFVGYLINFGFKENDIIKIKEVCNNKRNLENDFDNMVSLFSYFLSLGYSKKEIIKMVNFYPLLICINNEEIKEKIVLFEKIGYSKLNVLEMIKKHVNILGFTTNALIKKVKFLESLGFTLEEVIKITTIFPGILSFKEDNLNDKINFLISYGLNKELVINMIKFYPALLSLKKDKIAENIQALQDLNFTKSEMLLMISGYPVILGNSLDTLKKKMLFYISAGLRELIIKEPIRLLQSVEISYARFNYLKENYPEENLINNYYVLFLTHKRFQKRFNISKEELLNKYVFKEEIVEIKLNNKKN